MACGSSTFIAIVVLQFEMTASATFSFFFFIALTSWPANTRQKPRLRAWAAIMSIPSTM